MKNKKWHIICEKDVGLFSLIQQVICHVPLALSEGRIPIALFGARCCYWVENGYADKTNVWEYYFEPIVQDCPVDALSAGVVSSIKNEPPNHMTSGYFLSESIFVSSHFGDHSDFDDKAIKIPYRWDDPGTEIRKQTNGIIRQYVRPRPYIMSKMRAFLESNMVGGYTIGVHIRATDVNDLKAQHNIHRRHSYHPQAYKAIILERLKSNPNARVFIATDSQDALELMMKYFPERIIHYSSIYHSEGAVSGKGPTGWDIPGYLTGDTQKAAKNGEEAIIDYLLLSQCQYLIHNGSGLARTALLKNPNLPYQNIHSRKKYLKHLFDLSNLELLYFLKFTILKKMSSWYKFFKT